MSKARRKEEPDVTFENSKRPIERLLAVMAKLRDPDGGCPWDLEQDFRTIAPYTIEEAYEVHDAIERSDWHDLKDELGDLLLQVVFHAQMADEKGLFDFNDVADAISRKMIRRHPHVFGTGDADNPEAVKTSWEDIKAEERSMKAALKAADGIIEDVTPDESTPAESALDGVTAALPALLRAEKLTKRAARVGFDWTRAEEVLEKLEEEIAEVRHEISSGAPVERLEDEVGDMLFCIANLARKLGVDPEAALRSTNTKFTRRFRKMEELAENMGEPFPSLPLDRQEALWQEAKKAEKAE